MKRKVYISTFCTLSSYGSLLQSYALREALGELGISSAVISDSRENTLDNIRYFRKAVSLKNILYNLGAAVKRRGIRRRYEKNLSFLNRHIEFFKYDRYEELENASYDSNLFLAGSDQIFRPALCNPVFFLDFVPKGAKRISYAASMGSLTVPPEKEKEFVRLLNQFDSLSLREKDAAELARTYTDKEIRVLVDPTFLLSPDRWRAVEKEYPIRGRYILLYPLYWDRSLNRQLKAFHKRTGLPIVLLSDTVGIYHQKTVVDAGVEQFLWLIDHAEYVITSSFHGAALSILFGRKASMVITPKLPSRLNCLAETLEYPILPIERLDSSEIDDDSVNANIAREKGKSMAYLKQVLCDD